MQASTGIPLTDQGIFAIFGIFALALLGSYGFAWGVHQSNVSERREIRAELGNMAVRLAVYERSAAVFDQVVQSRVLALFEGANPVTPEEAAHIAYIRRLGANSEQVTEADLEWAIQILDAEYDAGLVPEYKRADAHLALAFLNAALERKRAFRECTCECQPAPARKAWWSR